MVFQAETQAKNVSIELGPRVAFAAVTTLPVETRAKNEISPPTKASLGHPGFGSGGRVNLTVTKEKKNRL